MERHFQRFLEILYAAASRVGADYFQLPVADGDAVYRERVYCYELYHQLRLDWDEFPFGLGGEIDKTGHPHFQDGPYARAKPDFLVHDPGAMESNLAVVEVKPVTTDIISLRKDLEKIIWFCHHAEYYRGVLVVYGEAGGGDILHRKVRAAADGLDLASVIIVCHRQVGQHGQYMHL